MFITRRIITPAAIPYVCRNFARFVKKHPDPGIGRRRELLPQFENEDVTDFEDLESDFMSVHKLHEQHEKELAHLKEREKYLIVREKYFKDKLPNFLTWYDKEQIRHLHSTDPDEWTVDRLSEGFPALPDVIKKIVKSNWVKMKQHKIIRHDESVQKNWKLFKQGQLKALPKDLEEHLNKFTNRALNLKPFVSPGPQKKVVEVKSKRSTEFQDIIKSYEKIKNGELETESREISVNVYDESPKGGKTGRSVTLTELQDKLTQRLQSGKNVDEEERHIINSVKNTEKNTISETHLVDLSLNKYETSTGLQQLKKTEKDYSHLNHPERIRIPKTVLKKGSTYKLNDCYYDDDGEFLYRVPGMG